MSKQFFLGILLLFWGAARSTAQTTTEHGFRYEHHTKHNGRKPVRGEGVLAYVDVYVEKFLLNTSKKNPGGVYRYEVPSASEELTYYPPLMDAVMLMSKGDSLTIYQNIDDNMRQYLPPEQKEAKELRFEIVLVDIITAEQKAAASARVDAYVQSIGQKVKDKVSVYREGRLDSVLIKSKSGLKVLIENQGNGAAVQKGEALQVHYYGCLIDGTSFSNSYSTRQPLKFPAGVGNMIAGFDEGVLMLNHGGRAYFFVPPQLGYGDQDAAGGTIPANSELIFFVEVL